MSLDEQNIIANLIRDRFDSLEATIKSSDERVADAIKEVKAAFVEHTAQDAEYWKRLDQQDAQISLIKWMGSGLSGSAILAWLYSHFGR